MRALNRAKKVAAKSKCNFMHAAIVFKGGAVLAEANNSGDIHAEVLALQRAGWYTDYRTEKNLTVLSVRVTNSGLLKCARPCPACTKYMKEHGVHTVLYSTDDGTIERLRLRGTTSDG